MRASALLTSIPGLTIDHLHNWERQGYLSPNRRRVGKREVRDYSIKDIQLIKAMWSYYQQGCSPKNAYRNAMQDIAKNHFGSLSGDQEQNRFVEDKNGLHTVSRSGSAIFVLPIPLRTYFQLKHRGGGFIGGQ